jgi:hypothetical protein
MIDLYINYMSMFISIFNFYNLIIILLNATDLVVLYLF